MLEDHGVTPGSSHEAPGWDSAPPFWMKRQRIREAWTGQRKLVLTRKPSAQVWAPVAGTGAR